MDKKIKLEALGALGGMQIVVNNEMLKRRTYISDCVEDQELAEAGALCGGHKACAVGSLLLGAGVKPTMSGDYADLPEANPNTLVSGRPSPREKFMADNPGVKLAYDALNQAAQQWADEHDVDLSKSSLLLFNPASDALERYGAMELLFEYEKPLITDPGSWRDRERTDEEFTLTRLELLRLVSNAVAIVEAA